LLANFCIALALQLGFLSGVFFNGLVLRSRRPLASVTEVVPPAIAALSS
jgi:hypothetical protein